MSKTNPIPRICNPEHRAAFIKRLNELDLTAANNSADTLSVVDTYEPNGKVSDFEWLLFKRANSGWSGVRDLPRPAEHQVKRQKRIEELTGEVSRDCDRQSQAIDRGTKQIELRSSNLDPAVLDAVKKVYAQILNDTGAIEAFPDVGYEDLTPKQKKIFDKLESAYRNAEGGIRVHRIDVKVPPQEKVVQTLAFVGYVDDSYDRVYVFFGENQIFKMEFPS